MKKKPRGKPFAKGNQVAVATPKFEGGALVLQHTQEVFARMASGKEGLVAIWAWCRAQGWSQSHTQTVLASVREKMREVTEEKAEDTRSRLLAFIENELTNHCTEFITGSGGSTALVGSEGTIILTHPETKEPLTRRNHKAIQGYLKLVMNIAGIDTKTVRLEVGDRPYRDMSTAELREQLKKIDEESAERAIPVTAIQQDVVK